MESDTFVSTSVEIIPPEGVPLRFELAAPSERLFAVFADLFYIFIFAAFFSVTLSLLVNFFHTSPLSSLLSSFMTLSLFALRQGYFFLFELLWHGSTPGKRRNGLKVVSQDGRTLTVSSLIARNLFRELELFLPLSLIITQQEWVSQHIAIWFPMSAWLFVMVLFPFLNKKHLRIGDLVAGTMVVKIPTTRLERDQAEKELQGFAPPRYRFSFSNKQLQFYGEFELSKLSEILAKLERDQIDLKSVELVAKTIAKKIGFDDDSYTKDPEGFLQAFYAAQRSALEKQLLFGKRKASKHDELK